MVNKSGRALRKVGVGAAAATLLVVVGTVAVFTSGRSAGAASPALGSQSASPFDKVGRYVMTDYDRSKPFTSFLPGVNGKYGMPLWSFYVNRGQAITSFGQGNKDGPIAQFKSASRAYQETEFTGFRTFIKAKSGRGKPTLYEPFGSVAKHAVGRDMAIGMNEVYIVDRNDALGLQTEVTYFTLPDTDYPGLVRRVRFKNTGKKALELEVLDGLAQLEPYGVDDWALKMQGRNLEGWMNVYNLDEDAGMPWFKLSASFKDAAEVNEIIEGNFALAWVEGEEGAGALPQVVDPAIVFGSDTSLLKADVFDRHASLAELLALEQTTASRTPCAFAAKTLSLKPGESVTINSVFGHAYHVKQFVDEIAPQLMTAGFLNKAYATASKLTEDITDVVDTKTGSATFDAYIRQMQLDNLLRGGYPLILGTDEDDAKPYHIYSRIHGDPERDYNNFQLDMTYYFQGPGNYRDVNQNRRCDVLQEPRVGDFNVRTFLALTQADGYNPLTVNGAVFVLKEHERKQVAAQAAAANASEIEEMLVGQLRPGTLFKRLKAKGVELAVSKDEFVDLVVGAGEEVPSAAYAQDGFWADHWTYDLDQLDSYLAIFPDKEEEFLWESAPVPFYQSPGRVVPREKKYVLKDAAKGLVRQFGAVVKDETKVELLKSREHKSDGGTWQTCNGTDTQFTTAPIGKLVLLCVVKFAMLDPAGMGVEMEAGKPGWNDAMNGLPGMIGSGMPETFELLRLLRYTRGAIKRAARSVELWSELDTLLAAALTALEALGDDDGDDGDDGAISDAAFEYWDTTRTALEEYRAATSVYFAGSLVTWDAATLTSALAAFETKVEAGVAKALALNGGEIAPAYFAFPASSFTLTGEIEEAATARPFVQVTGFGAPTMMPNFLEGPVRHLKVIKDLEARRDVFKAVKASELYDEELSQYLISGTLSGVVGNDVGRMVAFSPGWLENQSVWLHMSYKYYLELLRGGLFAEFWEEAKTGLTIFMDPKQYARSPLECASFIASSAHMDKSIHGTGFLARLSGSTAEFLSIWHVMMYGRNPFFIDEEGELALELTPALPSWLFDDESKVTFRFMGHVDVTYYNYAGIDTWDATSRAYTLVFTDGSKITLGGGHISAPYAEQVRSLSDVKAIEVMLTP